MTEEKKEDAKVVPAPAPAVGTPAAPAAPAVAVVPAPEAKPTEEKK